MKHINRTLIAGFVAGLVSMAPTLVAASGEGVSAHSKLHALSTLDQSDLMSMDAMSEYELGETNGEFFDFGINIAIAPQFNICIICNGVNQANMAQLSGFNIFR